jgi:putative heme-binding domain-containing protein
MTTPRTRLLPTVALATFCMLPWAASGDETAQAPTPGTGPSPRWIWIDAGPRAGQTVSFRKEFRADDAVLGARLTGACDNRMTVFLNGQRVAVGRSWETPTVADVTGRIQRGRNVLAVEAHNEGGPAGLLLQLVFEHRRQPVAPVLTDASWRAREDPEPAWRTADFDDRHWAPARVVAALGDAPWGRITAKTLLAASQRRELPATPIERLKVAKGFQVDLLYSVPQDEQGSWVSMALDPRGRLIVSDQYGKLYRVTLPPAGAAGAEAAAGLKVEPIEVAIGEAQGLLWAFDSLYVVVNSGGKFATGLYRVRDTDGDDRLDAVELLRKLEGGGEHGPHAVLLAPDGRSLYVLAGNATRLTAIDGSLVPRVWDEDQLLPRMPDGRGFMKDVLAPGGCVYRVDPDGKRWELVCNGFRNQYDAAFNRHGDLFTYDSDMEWDINTPWYRPTRVCLVASGGEFGWRNGAGVWPPHFPDSLPATVDIGPGSPTGVTFGYGARFPAKYQEALFVCDWSYGKLYAVHLHPDRSAYRGEFEEFITGTPLALTDLVVNPRDGAMYFAVGGRRTKSGLYRVTYTGAEPTTPAAASEDHPGTEDRALRRRLEAFHGVRDPGAVEAAWPYLGHPDRFVRFAARLAIEWQDVGSWRERALGEADPAAALTALLALARHGDASVQPRQLAALDRIDWGRLTTAQKIDLMRVYALTFIRLGAPDPTARERTIARFDPHFPSGDRILNAELCRMLVYLQAPGTAAGSIALLEKAPTQEEQLDYALHLRVLKRGWTAELRRAYFAWFLKAAGYRGGASFALFVQHIRDDALAAMSDAERAELKPILDTRPASTARVAVAPDRPFVKAWKLDDLAPVVEKGLTGRDYDRGRALFSTVGCFACHRYDNEGGSLGPDLTGVSGRFGPRDLLESILVPSKEISDQYGAVIIALDDGRVVTGRIVNLFGDNLQVLTDLLDPNAQVGVNRNQIDAMKPSPVSMMPEGLLNTLNPEEVLDLLAYLLSRGRRDDRMFRAGR